MGWRALAGHAGWALLALVAAAGWYLTARGLAFRIGIGEVSGGLGLVAALAVVITLSRWRASDARMGALVAGRCPRCSAEVRYAHHHARPHVGPGIAAWSCASCGFEHTEALTCDRCAA